MKTTEKEPKPLVIRFGQPKPDVETLDWRTISRVEVHGRLDERGKRIVDAALTNPVHRVVVHSMDDEARYSVDHFVT